MENRNGLIVNAEVFESNGTAERGRAKSPNCLSSFARETGAPRKSSFRWYTRSRGTSRHTTYAENVVIALCSQHPWSTRLTFGSPNCAKLIGSQSHFNSRPPR